MVRSRVVLSREWIKGLVTELSSVLNTFFSQTSSECHPPTNVTIHRKKSNTEKEMFIDKFTWGVVE